MASLQLKQLVKSFGEAKVIHGVDLQVHDGEFVVFVGPSGCGKSTLLRTFNRMFELYPEQRAEGQILLDGEDILHSKLDVSLIRAKVGMVFQKPTPFPMSIYDNIAFGVSLYESLSPRQMDERGEWALTTAARGDEAKDKLKQSGMALSGGQQQRLCIARAVAVQPEIFAARSRCHSAARLPSVMGCEPLVSSSSTGAQAVTDESASRRPRASLLFMMASPGDGRRRRFNARGSIPRG